MLFVSLFSFRLRLDSKDSVGSLFILFSILSQHLSPMLFDLLKLSLMFLFFSHAFSFLTLLSFLLESFDQRKAWGLSWLRRLGTPKNNFNFVSWFSFNFGFPVRLHSTRWPNWRYRGHWFGCSIGITVNLRCLDALRLDNRLYFRA